MTGFVVWMTGLSGTGKSTLASLLTTELSTRGVHVECLDGDEVRKILSHGLGFERDDRDRNVRRIGFVARMVARSGSCAITAAISPYRALRDEVRSKTENFIEVYCDCPLDVLTARDPKGLYKRALAGEIKNFTGVNDPYEVPENPEIHLRTDLSTPEQCIEQIIGALASRGLLQQNSGPTSLPAAFGGEVFEARPLSEAELYGSFKRIPISDPSTAELLFVGAGFLSPVTGFMTKREAHKVEKSSALERGTPWWDRPFVLELARGEDVAEGEVVLLTNSAVSSQVGGVVAEVTCEHVWSDGERRFLAGPLNAVLGAPAITARSVRRRLQQQGALSATCLFAQNEPTTEAVTHVAFSQKIAEAVVLGVAAEWERSWRAALKDANIEIMIFIVPESVPIGNSRAQAVMARSFGATKFVSV